MRTVFDVLSYLVFIASVIMFVLNLRLFKFRAHNLWVRKKEEIEKCSDNKVENAYLWLQTKILLCILPFFVVSLLCLFFGSAPKEIEGDLPPAMTAVIVVFIFIYVIGGTALFVYFKKTALKYRFMMKPESLKDVRSRNARSGALGFVIVFYQSLIMFFTALTFISNLGFV